jgi:hypothetical protein
MWHSHGCECEGTVVWDVPLYSAVWCQITAWQSYTSVIIMSLRVCTVLHLLLSVSDAYVLSSHVVSSRTLI